MDMLRTLLLAEEEQSRPQGAAHLRNAAGYQSAGDQSGTISYHNPAGGGAAPQVRAIGKCFLFPPDSFSTTVHESVYIYIYTVRSMLR